MTDYARAKATADRLIKAAGGPVKIRRFVSAGDDWSPDLVPSDHDATAAIVDYEIGEIDGTLILQTDQKAIIAKGDLTIEPTSSDKFVLDDKEIEIVRVKPLRPQPGGIAVFYEAQLRF